MTRRSVRPHDSEEWCESQIELWSTPMVIAGTLAVASMVPPSRIDDESAAHDCPAHPQTPDVVLSEAEGADCKRENEKAIGEGENRP